MRILDAATVLATHPRSFDRGSQVEDPAHIEELERHKRLGREHRATEGHSAEAVYEGIAARAADWKVDAAIRERIEWAPTRRPADYSHQMGWVLTAFQNALHELVNSATLKDAVIATVHCGGDTDTNAAICGALLGAVHGREAVPQQWAESIAACRATPERSRQPRPPEYWPYDALELADQLVHVGAASK